MNQVPVMEELGVVSSEGKGVTTGAWENLNDDTSRKAFISLFVYQREHCKLFPL
jgi:hypothetical protein